MASHGERSRFFPAIEARYGHPIEHWWDVLGQSGLTRYPDQMSLLQETHGFSRSHANATVMAYRGSSSSSRFDSPDDYFASLEAPHQQLARDIIQSVLDVDSQLTLVMAWNQPIVRSPADYVFGLSASRAHLSINPFSAQVLQAVTDRLDGLDVLKHTVRIPLDWSIDQELLSEMVTLRLAEIA